MTPLFSLDNVCFAYEGHIALRYITLDVARGETVVLQGSNGCGKSTLLKLLNGLVYAEEGTYRFDGDVIDEKSLKDNVFSKRFHQRVGFIFQNSDVQLFCGNVEEEISFGPRQMGLSEEEVKRRTDDVIALLGIEDLRERAPYHLSGGEKRKVAIACILSMNPEALVLDEPLAGLDRKTQEWLVGFLLDLKKAGKTLIVSTHNDELAHTLADRLVVIGDDHSIESITSN
ncbi:MAG: ABC transporter ATP-binding protein [Acutalibacteraceae bacterium]|nr:ABC transporter ATP-binding protein [Acutalibacteraceae bacterium]